jgi:ABC-type multidrug transport system ATPase subunit
MVPVQVKPTRILTGQPTGQHRGPVPPVRPFDLLSFTGAQLIIGRDPQAELSLPHPAISWQHARLEHAGPTWWLTDLKSRNRTFLTRGQQSGPVSGPIMLEVGDKIGIHPYTLIFTGTTLTPSYEIELVADSLRQVIVERSWKNFNFDQQPKILLKNVSLTIRPREFIAVLGGSGAGKSTLLRALSGYTQNEGRLYFNCYDYYANFDSFRGQVGFVPQADIIHGELSVGTALGYAAQLRLGQIYQNDEIERKVEEVIERLELTPQKDVIINNLSGGQRKRVSIAVELLTSPPLFFLDEPTSGLDPGLEADMMRLLRTLANDGHTVILVTHSVVNISLCDNLAVMGTGGVLVYFGPPGQTGQKAPGTALSHFGVREHVDIYRVVQPQVKKNAPYVYLELPAECDNPQLRQAAAELNQEGHINANQLLLKWSAWLESYYHQSQEYHYLIEQPVQQQRWQTTTQAAYRPASTARDNPAKNRLSLQQGSLLIRRYLALMRSDWRALALLMLQAPIIGLILAISVPKEVLGSQGNLLDAQRLLSMMACSVLWFGIINSAREIVKELPIYKRERFVNLNIFAYLFSKFSVLFFICAIQCALLLATIGIFGVKMSGKGVFFPLWFEFYIDLLLMALVGLGLGLLVSCMVSTGERVTSAIPIVLLPQIILNPTLLSNPEGLLKVLVNCLVASKWGLVALGDSADLSGKAPFNADDIYTGDSKGLLMAWSILLVMTLACLALAYFRLRYKDEHPRH